MFSALSIKWAIKYQPITLSITEFFPRSVKLTHFNLQPVCKNVNMKMQIFEPFTFLKKKKKSNNCCTYN